LRGGTKRTKTTKQNKKITPTISPTSCWDYCLHFKGGREEEHIWTDNNNSKSEKSDYIPA